VNLPAHHALDAANLVLVHADDRVGRVRFAAGRRAIGLDLAPDKLETLLSVDEDGLREELEQVREHLAKFGDRLPAQIRSQFEALEGRLK